MQPIFDYEIPLSHPLVVHFPITLILVGTAAVALWAARGGVFWYRVSALAFAGGALSSIAAFLTGEDAEDAAEDVPIVDEIVHLHEDFAIYAMVSAIATLMMLVLISPQTLFGSEAEQTRQPAGWVRWGIAAVAVVSAVLIAWTSHLGGIMVWGVAR